MKRQILRRAEGNDRALREDQQFRPERGRRVSRESKEVMKPMARGISALLSSILVLGGVWGVLLLTPQPCGACSPSPPGVKALHLEYIYVPPAAGDSAGSPPEEEVPRAELRLREKTDGTLDFVVPDKSLTWVYRR